MQQETVASAATSSLTREQHKQQECRMQHKQQECLTQHQEGEWILFSLSLVLFLSKEIPVRGRWLLLQLQAATPGEQQQ